MVILVLSPRSRVSKLMPHSGTCTSLIASSISRLASWSDSTFARGSMPGCSRWESHPFDEWFPLTAVPVCEVAFSRLDDGFLRHGARFM
jgi:hypothetical protein